MRGIQLRFLWAMVAAVAMGLTPATAGPELHLLGAGSLREAMTEIATTFGKAAGVSVNLTFGHSGLMREKIEAGAPADLFTSADMGHPLKLQADGRAALVAEFTRNTLCVAGHERTGLTAANVLESLLDPRLVVGIFPPKQDPAGDYAWQMFGRAETVRPGAQRQLEAKAKIVSPTLAPNPPPAGQDYTVALLRDGVIDLLVGYCSGAHGRLRAALPGLVVADLPPELSVGAHYGLAVMKDAKPEALRLALTILSLDGQRILKKHGFAPIGLPPDGER